MRATVRVGALVMLVACGGDQSAVPRAVAVSPDGVRQTTPSYSPDGKRLAYWTPATDSSANWHLWVSNADLSAPARLPVTNLGFQFPAIWSPDGSQLAASSSEFGLAQVVVVPVTGGAVRRVTQGAGFKLPIVWYRNGEGLSYFGLAGGGAVKSFVVNLRTGVSGPLAPDEKRSALGAPSPDGSHVAYFVIEGPRTTIWVADSAGRNARQLTTEGFEALEQSQEWSPDGTELLYESRRTGTSDLWIAPTDGTKPRQLTRDVRNDFGGAWSSDGKWIAFVSDRGRQTDLWVVPAAGGEERRVTDSAAEEERPVWRPGTNDLTFVVRSERSGVWALDVASGRERRLTPDSIRTDWFNVSPDGKQINYVIQRGGGIEDLAVMPFEGGSARVLVAGGGTVDRPYWSPDGSKIVFTSDRGGTYDVWVVDASGGAPRQLVNWPGGEWDAVWNGDGSAVYFYSDRDSRLGDIWRVSPSGGEPSRVTTDGSFGGGLASRAGLAEIFGGNLNPGGGQLAITRIRQDGRLQVVWDRTNAFLNSISPSGDTIAAGVEQPGGKMRSMLLSARGGGGRIILKPDEQAGNWSSDGHFLLYTTPAAGATDLGILRIADGTTRRLTSTPEDENGAEFTPDGKTVVFRRAQTVQRIYTADLSKLLTGGKP